MEVVAKARSADRDLALLRRAEARLDVHARHQAQRVLEVGLAGLPQLGRLHQRHASRHPIEPVPAFVLIFRGPDYAELGQLGGHRPKPDVDRGIERGLHLDREPPRQKAQRLRDQAVPAGRHFDAESSGAIGLEVDGAAFERDQRARQNGIGKRRADYTGDGAACLSLELPGGGDAGQHAERGAPRAPKFREHGSSCP
jgi:hypothetical protein